ncbi:tetraspanin-33 isoform X2 [Denticeps clupeoides]|uniref:tetraspanin-33 isoform X2 n=1 Tax=Denticeps clupeoides TaxID=299321 RepID=UPI0010A4FA07|nr:tetraspanin-33-like isoform X2 [Denticeps clupeoides]
METYKAIKYTLFICCYIFWVAGAVLIAVGIYAKIAKEQGIVDTVTADPALLLIAVGSLMFSITFCGCFGALRNGSILLQLFLGLLVVLVLLQIATAALGFVFSDMVLERAQRLMEKGIVRYRDDQDLENAIDFVQRKSVLNTMCGYGTQKTKEFETSKSIYSKGCLSSIVQWGKQNLLLISGLSVGLLCLEIIMISLAAVQLNQIKKVETRKKVNTQRNMNRRNYKAPHQ